MRVMVNKHLCGRRLRGQRELHDAGDHDVRRARRARARQRLRARRAGAVLLHHVHTHFAHLKDSRSPFCVFLEPPPRLKLVNLFLATETRPLCIRSTDALAETF